MRAKSLIDENLDVTRAIELIKLGARMAVLEAETDLSHDRLVRLYREVSGESPSKGQLPHSTDWFISWQPNIHSSLFMNIHENLDKTSALERVDLLIKSWQLYCEESKIMGVEPQLTITRAWRLTRFVDTQMLCLTRCSSCAGRFVTHTHEWDEHYKPFVCGLCRPPARAGKSRRLGAIR